MARRVLTKAALPPAGAGFLTPGLCDGMSDAPVIEAGLTRLISMQQRSMNSVMLQ
jgi:hypothetical protein